MDKGNCNNIKNSSELDDLINDDLTASVESVAGSQSN
jgi:hypothetical protein